MSREWHRPALEIRNTTERETLDVKVVLVGQPIHADDAEPLAPGESRVIDMPHGSALFVFRKRLKATN